MYRQLFSRKCDADRVMPRPRARPRPRAGFDFDSVFLRANPLFAIET